MQTRPSGYHIQGDLQVPETPTEQEPEKWVGMDRETEKAAAVDDRSTVYRVAMSPRNHV